LDHVSPCAAYDVTHNDRDDDRVVELSDDRNEVRDEVDRGREIWTDRDDRELRASGDSSIVKQALEQNGAVRDERGDRSRVLAAPEHQQNKDQREPERDRRKQCDDDPKPNGQAATARRSYTSSAI
jgi:hypothetical protein